MEENYLVSVQKSVTNPDFYRPFFQFRKNLELKSDSRPVAQTATREGHLSISFLPLPRGGTILTSQGLTGLTPLLLRSDFMRISRFFVVTLTAALALSLTSTAFAADGAALFKAKCGICHGADGQGKIGPALKGTA